MLKPVDPALKAAFDKWSKKGWSNYEKHGAVNFITSQPFYVWLEKREEEMERKDNEIDRLLAELNEMKIEGLKR